MPKNKNIKTNADRLREEFYKGMHELRESIKELKERQEKTDEQMRETDERIAKTDAEVHKVSKNINKLMESQKKTNRKVGELTNGWGKFVEGLVAPNMFTVFEPFGIHIEQVSQRTKKILNGETFEVDIISIGRRDNKKEVIIVTSVKSHLQKEDIDDFLKDMNKEFFKFFKEYKGKEVICAVAGIRLQTGIEKYAERNGLYILTPSGKTMVIINKPDFKPKIWR